MNITKFSNYIHKLIYNDEYLKMNEDILLEK